MFLFPISKRKREREWGCIDQRSTEAKETVFSARKGRASGVCAEEELVSATV
jgi:hypothetical protein